MSGGQVARELSPSGHANTLFLELTLNEERDGVADVNESWGYRMLSF